MTTTATLQTIRVDAPEPLMALVRQCAAERTPIVDYGVAHTGLGHPPPPHHLQLTQTGGVLEHYDRDLAVRAAAGVTLGDLQSALRRSNQFVPIDADGDLSLGEIINHHVYGGLRAGYGSIRDLLLGLRYIDAQGRDIRVGGRTVKNVAGYDMTRFMVGSLGELGLIYEATVRTYAIPEQAMMVDLSLPTASAIDALHSDLMLADARPASMTLSNLDGRWVARIRYFGRLTGCVAQLRSLETLLDAQSIRGLHIESTRHSTLDGVLTDMAARRAWRRRAAALVKIVVPPASTGQVCDALASTALGNGKLTVTALPVLGCIFVGGALDADVARALDQQIAGLAAALPLLRVWMARPSAPGAEAIAPFGPPQSDWPLLTRIKRSLDPHNLFNPGRFIPAPEIATL